MQVTRLFKSGNSQTVRIPVEFQFDTDEVEIFRRDDELVLRKKATSLAKAFHFLAALPNVRLVGQQRSDERCLTRLTLLCDGDNRKPIIVFTISEFNSGVVNTIDLFCKI
jgi:antitoxin VapB